MRIDRTRCLHGGACRLVAPEIDDTERIAVTSATLDAMAGCPSGALTWVEEPPAEPSTGGDPAEDARPGGDPAARR